MRPLGWRVGLIDSCGAWPGVHRAAAFIAAGNRVECRDPVPDPVGHGSRIADLLTRDRCIELLLAQVFTTTGATSGARVAAAIDWAAAGGANLIHLSLGLAADRAVLAGAVARALDAGCIVVAAVPARRAPRPGSPASDAPACDAPACDAPVYPAAYPGVIRATGDARCAPGELSCLGPGTFGACPRFDAPGRRSLAAGARGGASIGAAWVTWAIVGGGAPGTAAGVVAGLTAAARYAGPEQRSAESSNHHIESP